MKKIDKLVLGSFLGPFVLTFLVVVFILLTQHMLKYFDDIIGKDLGWGVLGTLLFYFAVCMIPVALPLAILLSSLITFGNLGEHFELELEDEDVDSVGGLLAKELGRLPARNDQIEFSGLIIRVDRVEGRRKRVVTALVKMSEDLIAARAALEVDEE